MPKIVGIRFKETGKIYSFSPGELEFHVGEGAVVETARGVEYGVVMYAAREIEEENLRAPLKPVLRKATEEDTEIYKSNREKRPEAIHIAKEKILKHGLNMKLLDAEFTFDQSKVIFYFTSDTRVDFRDLVKDLASHFRIRIELRQVGLRDESKILGGLGSCGRPCCCSSHLDDFERVSIKMAKVQGLSLNPAKISGLCGRLLCCLQYENDHYTETSKLMPKLNSEVKTPDGKGFVLSNDMLRRIVSVKIKGNDDSFEIKQFPLDKLEFKRPEHSCCDDECDCAAE